MTWWAARRRRTRRELAADALELAGLVVFAVLVYVVVVLGGGALTGRTSEPALSLSVLATAVLALAFDPVQTRLAGVAARVAHGGAPPPYDVLRRFTATATGTYPAEELPSRMARVLAEGTGATWSQVWLVVDDRPTLAATWPPGAVPGPQRGEPPPWDLDVPGRRRLPVRHGGELLGVLVVQEHEHVPLTSVEERLFAGLAGQAGLVLRSARLRAELEGRLAELSRRAEELRASRQRLVDVQDERRRTLERDIHDGAQQHLVALAVNLRLAHTLLSRSPDRAGELLASQHQAVADAIDTLAQLSRGIYPPLLAAGGLPVALEASVTAGAVPVTVTARDVGRYSPNVEAAAYFSCLEAVQNAAKHSGAATIRVSLVGGPEALTLTVEDDGRGFDPAATPEGAGLANIRDRVESVGGTVSTVSGPGRGTCVRATLPASPTVVGG
ncbi:ATP-binding protein [Nocardioides sp. MAHUQ-72]|uniref:GAF domain-containing sensor histidine kinase n=1 Tax=unclassified Nocardioides TaxID=2615069 RepID=UPI00360645F8